MSTADTGPTDSKPKTPRKPRPSRKSAKAGSAAPSSGMDGSVPATPAEPVLADPPSHTTKPSAVHRAASVAAALTAEARRISAVAVPALAAAWTSASNTVGPVAGKALRQAITGFAILRRAAHRQVGVAAALIRRDPQKVAIAAAGTMGVFALAALLGVMVARENQVEAPSVAQAPSSVPRAVSSDREVRLSPGERARLAGNALSVRLVDRAADGSSVRVSLWDKDPITLMQGIATAVPNGSRICDVTYVGPIEGRSVLHGSCRPTGVPEAMEVGVAMEQAARSGDVVSFAGGALRIDVSIVSPGGGTVRARLNDGPLETLEVDLPVVVYAGSDACTVNLTEARKGIARIAAACAGAAGRAIGVEADLSAALAPHRRSRLGLGETASFADATVDVYLASVAPGLDSARLSFDGGLVTPVALGDATVLATAGGPCAFTLEAIDREGVDLAAACFGRLAGPAEIMKPGGSSDSARAVVRPGVKALLIGDRVRIDLSMVSPDGEAVRWSLNDAGLRTTEFGQPASVAVGEGSCSIVPLRAEDSGVRVKAECDAGAMAARPLVAAGEDVATFAPNQTSLLLGGKIKIALSMISPDGEAVRIAVNDGDLRTLARAAPLPLDYGSGLCSVEYAGPATSGGALVRAACDAAALGSDVLVPERSEKVSMGIGDKRRLLDGRLTLDLSMISPDGEAIRFSANGGDLRTAALNEPIRFPSGEGRCEITYLGREGDRALIATGCDAAAIAADPFVPARTERVELTVARSAKAQAGRLDLAASMIAPDKRALRLAVNGGRLQTLERGRPLTVPIGTGRCQLAFLSYGNGTALIETVCDEGAFERAPVPVDHSAEAVLVHRSPLVLFDGRHTVELSMIAPRREAVRVSIDGRLQTLDVAKPLPLPVEGRDCALVLTGIGDDDRVRILVGCGSGLKDVVAAAPVPTERTLVAAGETVRLLQGAVSMKLEMISPSRTGLRVSIDGAKVSSLDRGVPKPIELAGRSCRLDYLGTDRTGPVEKAIVEGSCE